MIFSRFSVSLVLFSFAVLMLGCNCQSGGAKPSNPFAANLKTVPPPATFSSQESYLGQTPGTFIPQAPATTFPPPVSSSPSAPPPSNAQLSDDGSSNGKATVFTPTAQETVWTPADVASTSHTAFQAVQAKVNPVSSVGHTTEAPESLVVGASFAVTTIVDESQPIAALAEPQPLYSGKYTE